MDRITRLITAGGMAGVDMPETVLRCFNDMFSRQALNSGAIAIQAGGSPGAKTTATITAVIGGSGLVQKAAANLPALTGYNLTASQFGLVLFTLDAAGNFSAYFGQPAAALSGVGIPPIPEKNASSGLTQVAIGALVLQNAAAAFTGGTTALDAITAATYINIVGPFVPAAIL